MVSLKYILQKNKRSKKENVVTLIIDIQCPYFLFSSSTGVEIF